MLRTYRAYANLTFLGYEYAETVQEALDKTTQKFGPAAGWNYQEFNVTLIEWD